ncbi:MAG: hypothetical protein ACI7YS_07865 [Flavobacterium sp.]
MAKLYSKKRKQILKENPKKETISFLLNYSKALTIVKSGKISMEIISN